MREEPDACTPSVAAEMIEAEAGTAEAFTKLIDVGDELFKLFSAACNLVASMVGVASIVIFMLSVTFCVVEYFA